MANNVASHLNCTPIGRASDSMMDPILSIYFSWLQPDLVLSVAWLFEIQLVVSFCSGISMLLSDTTEVSGFFNTLLFRVSHRSYIRDLFVSCDDSLAG